MRVSFYTLENISKPLVLMFGFLIFTGGVEKDAHPTYVECYTEYSSRQILIRALNKYLPAGIYIIVVVIV